MPNMTMGARSAPKRAPERQTWWLNLDRESFAREVAKRIPLMSSSPEARQVSQSGGVVAEPKGKR